MAARTISGRISASRHAESFLRAEGVASMKVPMTTEFWHVNWNQLTGPMRSMTARSSARFSSVNMSTNSATNSSHR
ncbi:hypothetical protein D3C78_1415260 [compost metagenome]